VGAEVARAPWAGASSGPAFEVQYLLACGEQDAEELERYLATIGTSIAVARGNGRYRVHVHTDHAGPAIEAAIHRGQPSHIQVTYLGDDPAPD
jgi:dihydroxyacetone kinase-like predicted kinase